MSDKPEVLLSNRSYLEGPRWHKGRLWLSDMYTHEVLSLRGDGSDVRVEAEVPGQPSGLGWLPDGRLLMVSMHDRRILRREDSGEIVEHADLSDRGAGHLNDMVVDTEGRAYVGEFGFDLMGGGGVRRATLTRVDPDGSVELAADGLSFPNGVVLTQGELVLAESLGNRITAFTIAADGALAMRREWARFGDPPTSTDVTEVLGSLAVVPDGMTVDAEGALWVGDAIGQRVVRVRDGGEIIDEIALDTGAYACALGGDDGHLLFITCAPGFAEHERRDTREATLRVVRVDVPAADTAPLSPTVQS